MPLSTHPVIKLQGTETLDFIPEKMKEQAEKALNLAIKAGTDMHKAKFFT